MITDSNVVLKKGFYLSFDEFKLNRPSLFIDCDVLYDNVNYSYSLNFSDSVKLSKKIEVWGYCDGENVYVKEIGPLRRKSKYEKMTFIGRYCCLNKKLEDVHVFVPNGSGFGHYYINTHKKDTIIPFININNGKKYILDKTVLTEILKQDTPLLKKYESEVNNSDTKIKYLLLYSRKHKVEIKRLNNSN